MSNASFHLRYTAGGIKCYCAMDDFGYLFQIDVFKFRLINVAAREV